jgi:hypothetical protein
MRTLTSISTTNLLRTAAIVFAIATSSGAIAQTSPQATTSGTAATTAAKTAASGTAARNAVTSSAANTAAAAASTASTAQPPVGLTRAQVRAEFLEARKNGTLMETEADFDVAQTKKQFAH